MKSNWLRIVLLSLIVMLVWTVSVYADGNPTIVITDPPTEPTIPVGINPDVIFDIYQIPDCEGQVSMIFTLKNEGLYFFQELGFNPLLVTEGGHIISILDRDTTINNGNEWLWKVPQELVGKYNVFMPIIGGNGNIAYAIKAVNLVKMDVMPSIVQGPAPKGTTRLMIEVSAGWWNYGQIFPTLELKTTSGSFLLLVPELQPGKTSWVINQTLTGPATMMFVGARGWWGADVFEVQLDLVEKLPPLKTPIITPKP